MGYPCFQSQILVRASTTWHFSTDIDIGGALLTVQHTLTPGLYFIDTLRTEMLTRMVADGAAPDRFTAARISITSGGHFGIDSNGGAAFQLVFNDTNLQRLLGFTSATLTGANNYTASRRLRASWYPGKPPSKHDPMPFSQVASTRTRGGVDRGTILAEEREHTVFYYEHVDNVQEYVSPNGAAGTSYVGTGITDYYHAKNFWWSMRDQSVAGAFNQGIKDGRPFRYFADRDNADIPVASASNFTFTAADYTTWTLDHKAREDWAKVARQSVSNRVHSYDLQFPANEYVAP